MKGIIGDIAIIHFGSIEIEIENNRTKVVLNETLEQPQRFVFPEDTQVVTIKARACGGILASFSNDIVTDESWYCTDSSSCSSGGCSSSKWENAVTVRKNGFFSTLPKPPEIASSAQWIWISHSSAPSVWCKRTFGRFKYCIKNIS
jgi:hypothetical protein